MTGGILRMKLTGFFIMFVDIRSGGKILCLACIIIALIMLHFFPVRSPDLFFMHALPHLYMEERVASLD